MLGQRRRRWPSIETASGVRSLIGVHTQETLGGDQMYYGTTIYLQNNAWSYITF